MAKHLHPATTVEEQLAVLEESGVADVIELFAHPVSPIVQLAAVKINGAVLRLCPRALTEIQVEAVKQTSLAIEYATPKFRGKHPQTGKRVTARLAEVQWAAVGEGLLPPYRGDCLALVLFPECFDESLNEELNRALSANGETKLYRDVVGFSKEIIDAYLNEYPESSLNSEQLDEIRQALRQYVETGEKQIALLSWYKKNYPEYGEGFKQIEALESDPKQRAMLAYNLVRSISSTNGDITGITFEVTGI